MKEGQPRMPRETKKKAVKNTLIATSVLGLGVLASEMMDRKETQTEPPPKTSTVEKQSPTKRQSESLFRNADLARAEAIDLETQTDEIIKIIQSMYREKIKVIDQGFDPENNQGDHYLGKKSAREFSLEKNMGGFGDTLLTFSIDTDGRIRLNFLGKQSNPIKSEQLGQAIQEAELFRSTLNAEDGQDFQVMSYRRTAFDATRFQKLPETEKQAMKEYLERRQREVADLANRPWLPLSESETMDIIQAKMQNLALDIDFVEKHLSK